jgi:hypothetical protein
MMPLALLVTFVTMISSQNLAISNALSAPLALGVILIPKRGSG